MEETNLSFRDNPFKHEGKPTSNKLLGIKQGVLFWYCSEIFILLGSAKHSQAQQENIEVEFFYSFWVLSDFHATGNSEHAGESGINELSPLVKEKSDHHQYWFLCFIFSLPFLLITKINGLVTAKYCDVRETCCLTWINNSLFITHWVYCLTLSF